MRTFIKRGVSLLLSVTLLASQLPLALAAEEETEPTPLAGSGITLPEDAEGTFLAFAANGAEGDTPLAGWTLEEHGRYALTVYRAGDLSGETSVDLRTIDVSATYGRDYRVSDARYETEIFATGGTLMEQYSGDEHARALSEEILAEPAQPAGDAAKFSDVRSGSYYEKAVAWAIEQGITKGTDETHFSPDERVTRAQVVTFLHRAAGEPKAAAAAFEDVAKSAYYYDAVSWAADQGITAGVDAAHFAPNSPCTRAQIVTFLYRAAKTQP